MNTNDHTVAVPTVSFDRIVAYVKEAGVEAYVEQTGGGVATIFAGDVGDDLVPQIAAGPGWFEGPGWTNAHALLTEMGVGPYDPDFGDFWQADLRSTERSIASVIVQRVTAAEGPLEPPATP